MCLFRYANVCRFHTRIMHVYLLIVIGSIKIMGRRIKGIIYGIIGYFLGSVGVSLNSAIVALAGFALLIYGGYLVFVKKEEKK